jgi:class 3 adenylate cyclase
MALAEEIKAEVKKVLGDQWTTRDGEVVPESEDLKLGNDAVKLDGTVLYADLSASTALVDGYKPHFAAEIYKAYLYCAAKIIRSEGGAITAYDGDRVMAVFIGGTKNTSAARAGLKINWVVKNLINPAIKEQYPNTTYEVRHTVGIDTSKLFVARTGIRGSNDLVWVGRAANYAAKLTALSPDYPTRITSEVYSRLQDSAKTSQGKSMWETATWTDMNGITIYRSTWSWPVA